MRMKPKSTVHNPRALLYKRFTDVETSAAFRAIYHTSENADNYWLFDAENLQFVKTDLDPSKFQKTIEVSTEDLYLFGDFAFRFTVSRIEDSIPPTFIYGWQKIPVANIPEDGAELSFDIYVGTMQAGSSPFSGFISLEGLITKPVEEVKVLQNTGYDFLDFFVSIMVGDKDYHYGGYGFDPSSQYVVPSGTETSFVNNGETVNYSGELCLIQIGGIIEPSEEVEISATIKFKVKGLDLLSVQFNNIAKYQTNKYYYAGSFDYMIRGSVGSQDTQYIKGNIMHLRSFEIKHFDDNINIDHDDLVVIEGRLYSVSDLTYDIKRSPKPYTVYFATLNNIL